MNKILFEGVLDGIVVDRIIRYDEFSMPTMHFHPEYEIYYLLEGTRYYFIENKTYLLNKGGLVLISSMQTHRTGSFGKMAHDRYLIELSSEPFSIFFKNICGMALQDMFTAHMGLWQLDEEGQKYAEGLLHSIAMEFKGRRDFYSNFIMMKIAELLLYIVRLKNDSLVESDNTLLQKPKHLQINLIVEYISKNYANIKSLDEICGRFYISKSYLCRMFKEVTGFTVQGFISMRCVKKSQELLENTDMNISEISESLGFGTVTSFERIFRKYTETTPLKYRRKMLLIHQKVRERKKELNLSK